MDEQRSAPQTEKKERNAQAVEAGRGGLGGVQGYGLCRDEVREARANLGNYLERVVNRKEFYKFIEKKDQGDCIPLIRTSEPVVMGTKEAEASMSSSP